MPKQLLSNKGEFIPSVERTSISCLANTATVYYAHRNLAYPHLIYNQGHEAVLLLNVWNSTNDLNLRNEEEGLSSRLLYAASDR